MIGLVARYQCDRCGVVHDNEPEWRHAITPPTVQAIPAGSTRRWDGTARGERWWCADCTIALGGPEWAAACDAVRVEYHARVKVARAAWAAAMDTLGPETHQPPDPFMADWRARNPEAT